MGRYLLHEMEGKRFGSWTVLRRAENAENGQPRWLCRCDCGEVKAVRGFDLRAGKTTQCRMCAVHARPAGYGQVVYTLLHNARARAKKFGLPCSIVLSDIEIPTHCPLLGIPLKVNAGTVGDDSPSLDRIIPELGYVKQNIIVISFKANSIKQKASPNELMTLVQNLKAIMLERGLS